MHKDGRTFNIEYSIEYFSLEIRFRFDFSISSVLFTDVDKIVVTYVLLKYAKREFVGDYKGLMCWCVFWVADVAVVLIIARGRFIDVDKTWMSKK